MIDIRIDLARRFVYAQGLAEHIRDMTDAAVNRAIARLAARIRRGEHEDPARD